MTRLRMFLQATILLLSTAIPAVAALTVTLAPIPGNPASPRMGDRLVFRSVIHNDGAAPVQGLIAWISLVRTDPGQEQPMDLEDWSAHKAVTAASLEPGRGLEVSWPMRLIQSGRYRIVACLVSRVSKTLVTSPFVDFFVREKPVVASDRVLPVALGVPFLLGFLLLLRLRRGR